jgi:hypothetical protein
VSFTYDVRPADPCHRKIDPDAHEVMRYRDGRTKRSMGVWRSERMATQVAAILNNWASGELA